MDRREFLSAIAGRGHRDQAFGPKSPPPDEGPGDEPAPDAPEGGPPPTRDEPSTPSASPAVPWLGPRHPTRVRAPRDPWSALFREHRRVAPWTAARYEELWHESQTRRDLIWAGALRHVAQTAPPTPDLDAPANLHPAWFAVAIRDASPAQARALVEKLGAIWLHAPAEFALWAARLVHVTSVQSDPVSEQALADDEVGLLYEIVLRALQRADETWTDGAPLPSVRVAAMLHDHLHDRAPPARPEKMEPDYELRRIWRTYVTLWRKGYRDWMLGQLPPVPAWRLLVVLGESGNVGAYMTDAAARAESSARADRATATIRWHLDSCPGDKCLVVLLTGGQVRSPSSEAEIMASELNKPHQLGSPLPPNLCILRDGLARHTSTNLRAGGQLALRLGLPGFWVQTGPSHAAFKLNVPWLADYRRETSWGLNQAQRTSLRHAVPMVRQPCGSGANIPEGRARYVDVKPIVFLPAIGDALNP